MAIDSRQQKLTDKALRVLAGRSVADAVAQVRAIIGPEQIPDSERLAQVALEKMRNGEAPTPEEVAALSIVIRVLRPVLLVTAGDVEELPRDRKHDLHTPQERAQWDSFRAAVRPFVPSVGRVQTAAGTHIGSGFIIGDGLLATNRHVLGTLSSGSDVLPSQRRARVVFTEEYGINNRPDDFANILDVAAIHPNLDLVVLRIQPQGRSPVPLSLELVEEGMPVAVIGYPAEDNQNPVFLEPVFNGIYGHKRAALGEVLDGLTPTTFFHDCSTTQGNSGSPVFSVRSGQVIGIHRAGHFMYRNEAVPYAAWSRFLQGITA